MAWPLDTPWPPGITHVTRPGNNVGPYVVKDIDVDGVIFCENTGATGLFTVTLASNLINQGTILIVAAGDAATSGGVKVVTDGGSVLLRTPGARTTIAELDDFMSLTFIPLSGLAVRGKWWLQGATS